MIFWKEKKTVDFTSWLGWLFSGNFNRFWAFLLKQKSSWILTQRCQRVCATKLCHVKNPKYYHTSIKFLFFICICVCFWQTVNHMKTQKFDFRQKIYWRLFEQKWKTFQMAGGALVIFDKQRKKLYHYI